MPLYHHLHPRPQSSAPQSYFQRNYSPAGPAPYSQLSMGRAPSVVAMFQLGRYLLLGAVIVVPIWLILRFIRAPQGR